MQSTVGPTETCVVTQAQRRRSGQYRYITTCRPTLRRIFLTQLCSGRRKPIDPHL